MKFKVSELCSINEISLKTNHKLKYINYLDTSNLTEGKIDTIKLLYPNEDKIPSRAKRIVRHNDILYSTVRPVQKHYGFIKNPIDNLICSTGFVVLSPNNKVDPYFLYKYLTQEKIISKLQSIAETSTTTYPSIKPSDIGNLELNLPNLKEQQFVSNILYSLDYKIEINNKINNNLEELAQTLYKHWFVDFEFPNEEGLPYKSSGGEMVDSELGNIPEGWIIYNQGDFSPVITGKKNANIATSNGDYKFFTCGQEPLLTDDFSFDAEAILVAGNGDFNVKYYRGKFEAYQRTYVLIPHISKLTPLLYFSIKNNLNEITKGHRGSVIKFITKGDLENYKLALPIKEKLLALSSVFTTILNKITTIKEENEKLANIRDLLLPKLMSGEIRVPVEE